jgi:hypothetical protein
VADNGDGNLVKKSRCPPANPCYCKLSLAVSSGSEKGSTETENHGVGGSIPPLGTIKINSLAWIAEEPPARGLTTG